MREVTSVTMPRLTVTTAASGLWRRLGRCLAAGLRRLESRLLRRGRRGRASSRRRLQRCHERRLGRRANRCLHLGVILGEHVGQHWHAQGARRLQAGEYADAVARVAQPRRHFGEHCVNELLHVLPDHGSSAAPLAGPTLLRRRKIGVVTIHNIVSYDSQRSV